jgi:protein phosphatase
VHPDSDVDTLDDLLKVTDPQGPSPRSWPVLVRAEIGALSHPGKVRPGNEDHFLTACFGRSMVPLQTNLAAGQIPDRFAEVGYALVVADGMGGHAAGEVASSLAISLGVNLALNSPKWNLTMTPEGIRESMETWRQRISQIDALLKERGRADPALAGMGTTLTLACSVGAHLCLYHAGDSRAYLFRRGHLQRLTQDHTVAQSLVDVGLIRPEQAARHHLRHVLTRALGGGNSDSEAEIHYLQLDDGDRLLLCTDGLTEMVSDARIAEVLGRVEGSEGASRALVEQALDAGGKDNVTVVLARYAIPADAVPSSSTGNS